MDIKKLTAPCGLACFACGIYKVSFHKMRHTAATEMLEAGIDISVVQKVLGHTDIATTKIYAHGNT